MEYKWGGVFAAIRPSRFTQTLNLPKKRGALALTLKLFAESTKVEHAIGQNAIMEVCRWSVIPFSPLFMATMK